MKCFKLILISLLVCFIGSRCAPEVPEQCKEFYSLTSNQQEKVFPTYSLEKQIVLHRCGMDHRPPTTVYSIYIAERGEPAIPFLLERLESEKNELSQYAIIDIFEVMSIKGYLRNRSDVVSRIRQVVSRMKISTFKEMAQKDLDEIEKNNL